MKAYRKTTHHPICLYLTEAEALALAIDIEVAAEASNDVPTLVRAGKRLDALVGDPKRRQA